MVSSTHMTYLVILSVIILMYINIKYYELKKTLYIQNAKAINLYLDKKFIKKLLRILVSIETNERLRVIMEEVSTYFFIDFIAIKNLEKEDIIKFKNQLSPNFLTDYELNSLLAEGDRIDDSGYKEIQNNLGRQLIIFKNDKVIMLIITENSHKLNQNEISTISAEIMLLSSLAFDSLDKEDRQFF